jgi:hypothetical protein
MSGEMTRRRACLVLFAASRQRSNVQSRVGDRKWPPHHRKNDVDFYYLVEDTTKWMHCHGLEPTGRQLSDPYFPINQLPIDVLTEIFIQCLPKIKLWPEIKGKSTMDVAPLLLCNVCSSWRALAVSTPCLWQRLFITFRRESKQKEEAVSMTHIWIKR